ncbi:unnamed protein product [Protopolystoma xenopodis]|uniref:NPHP4 Ig-like domain-containing protein n=1 Tax=Protopolystoma xenopodis TaxID=117903 RepID=A0A3S4ZMB9_9PLAT|nr:unnamed protein product [Protopolystoma xenopodis]
MSVSCFVCHKETTVDLEAGVTGQLGLRFIPQLTPTTQLIYVFIRDEQGKTEEIFAVRLTYT